MTRDEFLLRDFLVNWLYQQYVDGVLYRLQADDVISYLRDLARDPNVEWLGGWTDQTEARVASGLLRIAADFGLLSGGAVKEFASYHLPDESFVYLLQAMAEAEDSAPRIIGSPEWHLYLLDASDVERELLRLHQFHRLGTKLPGSLVRLDLLSPR